MASQIITAPDYIPGNGTGNSILILNSHKDQLTTLVLWLKTVRESYNIHLWHQFMPDTIGWAQRASDGVDVILAYKGEYIPNEIKSYCEDRIIWFGPDTEYPDLIHYFFEKEKLEV